MKSMKKIPKFKSADKERAFWASHDASDYIDWKKGKRATFPNLKPSAKSISLRPGRMRRRPSPK